MPKKLKALRDKGFSYPYMERCLRLPQGTMRKWEADGKVPRDGKSLVEIITLFPWILELADDDFKDPVKALMDQVEITIKHKKSRKIGF